MRNETLPEAQRTQDIDSVSWVVSKVEMKTSWEIIRGMESIPWVRCASGNVFFYNFKQSTENISYKLIQISCVTTNVQNNYKRTIKKFLLKDRPGWTLQKEGQLSRVPYLLMSRKHYNPTENVSKKSMPILLCRQKHVWKLQKISWMVVVVVDVIPS